MAILHVDKDWRIDSDPMNWILQKRSVVEKTDVIDNIGKEVWKNEGYYPTLAAALKGLTDKAIKIPATIQEVADKVDELQRIILERVTLADAVRPTREPVVTIDELENGPEDDDLDDMLS